jgi:hypothetical protein
VEISEGSKSELWNELRPVLPHEAFERFASLVGYEEHTPPTWDDLARTYELVASEQIKLGHLAKSTRDRYRRTLSTLSGFLATKHIRFLKDITKAIVEQFKVI